MITYPIMHGILPGPVEGEYNPLEEMGSQDHQMPPLDHNSNLVFHLDSGELAEIQEKVWHLIKKEEESYEDIEEKIAFFIDLAGFQMPTRNPTSSSNATGSEYIKNSGTANLYSAALGETILAIVNNVVSRFFDSEEFVDVETTGPLTVPPKTPGQEPPQQQQQMPQDPMAQMQDQGPPLDQVVDGIKYRVKKWYKAYFSHILREYKDDIKKTLMWSTTVGNTTRKMFFDPTRGIPNSNFIPPGMLLRNNTFDSFFKSTEYTHKYYLTKKEIQERVDAGVWSSEIISADAVDDDTGELEQRVLGIQGRTAETDSYETRADDQQFAIYERYMYLEIEGDCFPCVITCSKHGNLGSIMTDFNEGDPLRLPKDTFVDYDFLPSYGGTSMGLANVAGQNARAATVIERRLIDASIAAAFPPTFVKPNAKFQKHTFEMQPGKITTLPVGDDDISKAIVFAPVAAPNPFMADLKKDLEDSIRKYSLLVSQEMMDIAQRAPQMSALGMLTRLEELPNSIIQGFYNSFAKEIRMFKNEFYKMLPDDNSPFTLTVAGEQLTIYKNDFCDFVEVLPACGYSKQSDAYKFMRAEIISQQAQANPDIHNRRAVAVHLYKEMGVPQEQIDGFLPMPPPPNPADIVLMEAKQMPQIHDMRSVLAFYYQSKQVPQEMIEAVLPPPPPPEQQPTPIDPGVVGMAEVEAQKQIAEMNAKVKMAQIDVERESSQARVQVDLMKIELAKEKQEKEFMETEMKILKDQHGMELEEKNIEIKERELEIENLRYESERREKASLEKEAD